MMKSRFNAWNKRGDISTTILVLGIFAVCSLAIFSFYSSTSSFKENFSGIFVVQKIDSFGEKVKFYQKQEIGKNPEEVMDIFGREIVEGDFSFSGEKIGEDYVLTGDFSKRNFELFGFGIGERKSLIYAEYTLRN